MWDVSGTTGSAPVWAAVMNYLHRAEPSRAPQAPPGLVRTRVHFDAPAGGDQPVEASRSEWFLQGTEQSRVALNEDAGDAASAGSRAGVPASATAGVQPRIMAPTSGTIIALDPDIPPLRQRLTLVAQGSDTRWLMDGKPLARGSQVQWLPWPGRHLIQLADTRGTVLDEVRVEVRGAAVIRR
jgi:penicillin-binding protein 1C